MSAGALGILVGALAPHVAKQLASGVDPAELAGQLVKPLRAALPAAVRPPAAAVLSLLAQSLTAE